MGGVDPGEVAVSRLDWSVCPITPVAHHHVTPRGLAGQCRVNGPAARMARDEEITHV
jgi:hypothetical protein